MLFQPDSVRHEFPLRPSYFRGVLRLVAGFPDLRLLCPIRHPSAYGSRKPTWFLHVPRFHPSPRCFRVLHPIRVPTPSVSSLHFDQEPSGLPGFIVVSLSACHGLRTPPDLHTLAYIVRVLLCCLRCTLKPSASGSELVEAVPALQGARPPLRPTEFSVYAYLTCCSQLPAPQ